MQFGGAHYTAIIRVYHAWQDANNVRGLCPIDDRCIDGHLLHELHRMCSSFWWNLGSAIDNLGKALEDAPPIKEKDGKAYLATRYPQLSYAYDRRTQVIHSRLIPIGVDGGIPFFFLEHVGAAKYTDWNVNVTQQTILQDFYEDFWCKFLAELTNVWWHVFSLMQTRDVNRPNLQMVTPETVHCGSGSGVPRSYVKGMENPEPLHFQATGSDSSARRKS